jgi:trans-aconitate 2-methyltransferase
VGGSCAGRPAEAFVVEPSLLDVLAPQAGERILDVGCGTGHFTARIAEAGAEVIGIDVASDKLDWARHTFPHVRFEVADARDFAAYGAFDAVFCNAMIHWVKNPGRVFARVSACLKPGGRFVLESGGRAGIETIVAAVRSAAEMTGSGDWEAPWRFPSVGEYASLLEHAGLEITYVARFDRPTPLGGKAGLWRWIESLDDLMDRVAPSRRPAFRRHVEERLRPSLFPDGRWNADYLRILRIVARRPEASVASMTGS